MSLPFPWPTNLANLTRSRHFYCLGPTPFLYTIDTLSISVKKCNFGSKSFPSLFIPCPTLPYLTLPYPPCPFPSLPLANEFSEFDTIQTFLLSRTNTIPLHYWYSFCCCKKVQLWFQVIFVTFYTLPYLTLPYPPCPWPSSEFGEFGTIQTFLFSLTNTTLFMLFVLLQKLQVKAGPVVSSLVGSSPVGSSQVKSV